MFLKSSRRVTSIGEVSAQSDRTKCENKTKHIFKNVNMPYCHVTIRSEIDWVHFGNFSKM